jgi:hypothetical protein
VEHAPRGFPMPGVGYMRRLATGMVVMVAGRRLSASWFLRPQAPARAPILGPIPSPWPQGPSPVEVPPIVTVRVAPGGTPGWLHDRSLEMTCAIPPCTATISRDAEGMGCQLAVHWG